MLLMVGLFSARLRGAEPAATAATAGTGPRAGDSLPLVRLEAKETIVSERKVPCAVRLVLPGAGESGDAPARSGVVRIHGASSQMYPKRSFGLTLDTPVTWLGMRESAHWVLNAAFVDRSLMRHKLSYDLFRALSLPEAKRFAAASRFVEVSLNGRYHGVFLLMERVDRALLQLRPFNSNETAHACIYKAVDHGADFGRPGHGAFEQREPDPLTRPYWGPLDQLCRFTSRSQDAEFFDGRSGIATRLDLDNTIDFHLLLLLTSNMDGNDKNLIVARDGPVGGAPGPRFFFAPWDYDATFGRNWNATPVGPDEWVSNFLFDRLLGDRSYRAKFGARWQALRRTTFSAAALALMVDENVHALGAGAKRNMARWRTLDGPYPDRLSFDEDVAQIREWIPARLSWLDRRIGQLTAASP